jgi:hypothetical protein
MEEIASIDLFVVPTIAFSSSSHFLCSTTSVSSCCGLRRPQPDGRARQITEEFSWDTGPKYLIRDNDRASLRTKRN